MYDMRACMRKAYVHEHGHACVYVYAHVHVYLHAQASISLYVCTRLRACVPYECEYVYDHDCLRACVWLNLYVYDMHVFTKCTCMCIGMKVHLCVRAYLLPPAWLPIAHLSVAV